MYLKFRIYLELQEIRIGLKKENRFQNYFQLLVGQKNQNFNNQKHHLLKTIDNH